MINSVRNTVLSVLNKNNFGYLSPADFNLYAKQAQLEIFERYFSDYNNSINKENLRMLYPQRGSGTGYADSTKGIEEVIDTFSVLDTTSYAGGSTFTLPADYYLINKILPANGNYEAEQVNHSKISLLNASLLTAPSLSFPAYTQSGNQVTVYPETLTFGMIQYIRYPLDPQWTYINLSAGEPVFNESAADYQDFELPLEDEPDLILKILQYAGVSIRESDVYNFANQEEIEITQQNA